MLFLVTLLLYIDDFREMPHDYSDRINNLELISSFFFFLKEEKEQIVSKHLEHLEFENRDCKIFRKKKVTLGMLGRV